jgi:hypothetical protein
MAIRSDHVKHFFVCFMVSALGTIPWQIWHQRWMLVLPVGLGLLAGFCKEFADIGKSGFDWTDIIADVLGVGGAILLLGVTYGL